MQPSKADTPILSVPSGRVTEARDEQPAKAFLPIVTAAPTFTLTTFTLPLKASVRMPITGIPAISAGTSTSLLPPLYE